MLDDLHFGTSSTAITGASEEQTHSKARIQTANMLILPAALLMFPGMDCIVQPERIISTFPQCLASGKIYIASLSQPLKPGQEVLAPDR